MSIGCALLGRILVRESVPAQPGFPHHELEVRATWEEKLKVRKRVLRQEATDRGASS